MNDFGKKLKELRGDQSIREASRNIGISHTYLDSLEKVLIKNWQRKKTYN